MSCIYSDKGYCLLCYETLINRAVHRDETDQKACIHNPNPEIPVIIKSSNCQASGGELSDGHLVEHIEHDATDSEMIKTAAIAARNLQSQKKHSIVELDLLRILLFQSNHDINQLSSILHSIGLYNEEDLITTKLEAIENDRDDLITLLYELLLSDLVLNVNEEPS